MTLNNSNTLERPTAAFRMTRHFPSGFSSLRSTVIVAGVAALAWGAGSQRAESAEIPQIGQAVTVAALPSNRLIHETSPYLLQHAHNPVDWFSWGDEAFAKAKRENKPVFLSVGYSTCYWCHVMEKESFEDVAVARILNERFVAIKVDREERPELDEHYLMATQLLTGKGGWPNSVWLTPAGEPWMASTYLPKPKFIAMLNRAADRWNSRLADVNRQVTALAAALAKADRVSMRTDDASALTSEVIDKAVAVFLRQFDPANGGFGGAPKFPPHGALAFLIRQCGETDDKTLRNPITKTLDAMWLGGLHDHLGGGFHRYSTDDRWLVPHFEKMLYDNAQLMRAYTDGYLLTGQARYREAVEDIFSWVQREMTSPQGAFYSAIDAGDAGREGEAYVWRLSGMLDVLGRADGTMFAEIYHVEEKGNFVDEATGKRRGTNIPFLGRPIEVIAQQRGEDAEALAVRLASMRARLFARRQNWPQPRRDDKVIASWNGLMIGALAHAGYELHEPRYILAAKRAADFLRQNMLSGATLLRTYRAGEARIHGYLEDYACVAAGFIELHRASGDPIWLAQAEQLAVAMLADFQDVQEGGFFFTGQERDERILRSKNRRGSSNQPDANGVAAEVLLDLARLTGKADYATAARQTLESLAGRLRYDASGSEHGLIAAAAYLRDSSPTGAKMEPASPPSDVAERIGAVTIRVYTSRSRIRPGESLDVAIALDVDPAWHLYSENPATAFLIPTSVSCEGAGPLTVRHVDRPEAQPVFDQVLRETVNIYRGRVWFRMTLAADAAAPAGAVALAFRVVTQACDDTRCLPAQTVIVRIPLTIDPDAMPKSRQPEVFPKDDRVPTQ